MRAKAKMRMPNQKTRLRRLRDKYGRGAEDHRRWIAGGGLLAGATGIILWLTLARDTSRIDALERDNKALRQRQHATESAIYDTEAEADKAAMQEERAMRAAGYNLRSDGMWVKN
jgi:hypothetical protein